MIIFYASKCFSETGQNLSAVRIQSWSLQGVNKHRFCISVSVQSQEFLIV